MSVDFTAELAAERRVAARLLLASPLVTAADHPEEFPLVRRHADELARQFSQVLGYQLVVEPGFARLHKAGLGRDAGRRLERASGAPFTPRTYAYLALALSVLVTAPEQLLLSELVTRTRAAAAEAGVDLGEPNRPVERRAMVAALRQLADWRVLAEEEGSVDAYAGNDRSEALLTIDREIARRLVGGTVGRAGSPDELIAAAAGPGPGGPRHYVRRRLVETPVVHLDDLTVAERGWLRQQQRREQRILEDFLGLDAEIRAEGAALLDPDDELSDLAFPGTGTVAQAALLLVERLVEVLRPAGAGHRANGGTLAIGVPVPAGLVETSLVELVERHRRHWAKEYVEAPDLLRHAVVDLLHRMRLLAPAGAVRADDETALARADRQVTDVRGARGTAGTGWVLLAAAARYAPVAAARTREDRP